MNLAAAAYVILMLFGALTGFVKFFILGRLLTAADFGQYSFLNAVILYSVPIASFGIVEGLSRKFPILLGQGRHEEAYAMRNRTMGAIALTAAAVVLLTAIGSGLFQLATGRSAALFSTIVAVEVYAYIAFSIGLRDIRNHLHSALYAGVTFTKGVIDLGATFILAPRFGVAGVLVGETIILIIAAALVYKRWMPQRGIVLQEFRRIVPVMKEGIALTVFAALANSARMGDRLILGAVLPKAVFAVYAFHLIVISAGLIVTNVLSQYVGPRSLHLYGQSGGDTHVVFDYLARLTVILAILGALGAAVVPYGFDWVAAHFFRQYTVNHTLLFVLYAAMVIDVANLFPLALLAFRKFHLLIAIHLVPSVLLVAGCLIAHRMNAGLVSFAVLALLARLGIFIAAGIATVRLTSGERIVDSALPMTMDMVE